jgi:hypothetical protein
MPRASHGGDPEAEEQRVSVLGCPFFGALVNSFVGFVEGFALLFTLYLALLLGCVFDVVCGGGSVGGDDGWSNVSLCDHLVIGLDVPINVPVEATRKARNGTVSARKEWYLRLAAMTAPAPIAVPMTPPIDPPLIVALRSVSTNIGIRLLCAKLTCNAPPPLLS